MEPSGHSPKIEGYIHHFNLIDWWLTTFTDTEREYIESRYHPMGSSVDHPLSEGKVLDPYDADEAQHYLRPAQLLWGLATWFRGPHDRSIARRILAKAEELAEHGKSIIDRHFVYQGMIQTFCKDRETDEMALIATIAAREKQISLAPEAAASFRRDFPAAPLPRHVGFEQLAIIREKQGNCADAIHLSKTAREQGWRGDWETRIARCEKKLAKREKG